MIEQGDGQILLITSASGARPTPGAPLYSAARAGATMLTRNVADEVARNGVQVNAVGTNFMDFPEFIRASGAEDPEVRERIESMVPLGRLGTMEEFAAFCMPFVDGSSRFTTGSSSPTPGAGHEPPVAYALEGPIATITMDDGKVNALSIAMLGALHEAFDRAERDGAVVLLGGREGYMSAGFDLKVFAAGGEGVLEMLRLGATLYERMLSFPTPGRGCLHGPRGGGRSVPDALRRRADRRRRPLSDGHERGQDRADDALVRDRDRTPAPAPRRTSTAASSARRCTHRGRRSSRASSIESSPPARSRRRAMGRRGPGRAGQGGPPRHEAPAREQALPAACAPRSRRS